MPERTTENVTSRPNRDIPCRFTRLPDMVVHASLPQGKETRGARKFLSCLWVSSKSAAISHTVINRFGWWLPPVIWPDEEDQFRRLVLNLWRDGARSFVLNSPWQVGLFTTEMLDDEKAAFTAGPFCNISNPATVNVLKDMGFTAAIVSPELGSRDFLELPRLSPLPLGMVLAGCWPVGMSRYGTLGVRLNEPFMSPKHEAFWARQYGENTWIYPAWQLNLSAHKAELEKAGYSFFVSMQENIPASLPPVHRPGLFNWDNSLM